MDDLVGFAIFGLLGAIIFAVAGYFMLDRVGRGVAGALLGLLLGPVGLVIAWIMRDNGLRDEEERRARHGPRVEQPPKVMRGFGGDRPVRTVDAPASQPSASIDELERLAALREKGHLTADEFEREKGKLLEARQDARRRGFR